MKAYVITWKYSDNSDAGLFKTAYQSEALAKHVLESIQLADPVKTVALGEIEIVMGDLE